MKRLASTLLAFLFVATPMFANKQFVVVPETTWADLSPYVEANIRVEFADGALMIGATAHPYERLLFEPYDSTLGEFATVLISEAIRYPRIRKRLEETTAALKSAGVDPTTTTKKQLEALFWDELTTNTDFMVRLERLFRKAQAKGRLECFMCGEGFEPQYVELR